MFHLLNVDYWLLVIPYLTLEEQLVLREVTTNLETYVTKHWKCLKTARIDGTVLQKFEVNPSLFSEFSTSACRSLQKLTINGWGTITLLNSWNMLTFPNLHTLHCDWKLKRNVVLHPRLENAFIDQRDLARWQQADEISLLITEIFPQLRSLTLRGLVNGSHLWRLSELEELHIYKAPHTCGSKQFFARMFVIPKLKKLTLRSAESLMILTMEYPEKVQSVRFIRYMTPLDLSNMTNLRELALHRCNFDKSILDFICSEGRLLEQIHFTKMKGQFNDTNDLWKMVLQCENLEVLNLCGSVCAPREFVDLSAERLHIALTGRKKQLKLYVGPMNDSLKTLTELKHPMLKIMFEPFEWQRKKVFYTEYLELGITAT